MEFAFRSDAGLRVTYHDTTAHCYLREVDVMAHGVSPDTMNDNSTEASFDSSPARLAIREAGWETFEFRKDKGEETADLFASCQYLASLPSNTNKVKVLKAVATSLEEPAEEALVIMQKAGWNLNHLYALLNGECNFPDSADGAAILLPENKTVPFPTKLLNIPEYKQMYNEAKSAFVAKHKDGVSLVSHPDLKDKRVFSCPACSKQLHTPIDTAKHMGTHTELVGKTAYFANAKFQTSKCQATVQKCAQRKIEQFTISQPAAKRVKSSKDGMAQMREMLAMTTTNLNLSLAAGAEQAKQHTKLIESINTKDAHVTRLLEQKDTDQEMIKTLVGTVTSVQPLAAAQETKNRLEAFLGKSTNPN